MIANTMNLDMSNIYENHEIKLNNEIIQIFLTRHSITGELYMQCNILTRFHHSKNKEDEQKEYILPQEWWDTKGNREQFSFNIIEYNKRNEPIFEITTTYSTITKKGH